MDAVPTCSRLGCDEPAEAVFGFDARECLVWLDPLAAGGRGAGLLCDRHADRMSPPRGWNLFDRRGAESRLWIGRTDRLAESPAPRRRARASRARACGPPGARLPFDAAAPEPAAQLGTAEPTLTSWSPRARPGPEFDRVIDARSPMLARAFESARPVDDPE